jgi:putative ABC transport system permease protein
MRSLGAGRRTVMIVVLLESVILAMAGGLLGWLGGHTLVGLCSHVIENRTGVAISAFDLSPPLDLGYWFGTTRPLRISAELLLVPGLTTLAILVGLLPAMAAYRTDVARALSATP